MVDLEKWLKQEEGFASKPYRCPSGHWTIGYGHRIIQWSNYADREITKSEAEQLLLVDMAIAHMAAEGAVGEETWQALPKELKNVLAAIAFQVGGGGLRGFKKMLAAFCDGDWPRAARELRDSRLYAQTPDRVERLINIIMEVANGHTKT